MLSDVRFLGPQLYFAGSLFTGALSHGDSVILVQFKEWQSQSLTGSIRDSHGSGNPRASEGCVRGPEARAYVSLDPNP